MLSLWALPNRDPAHDKNKSFKDLSIIFEVENNYKQKKKTPKKHTGTQTYTQIYDSQVN